MKSILEGKFLKFIEKKLQDKSNKSYDKNHNEYLKDLRNNTGQIMTNLAKQNFAYQEKVWNCFDENNSVSHCYQLIKLNPYYWLKKPIGIGLGIILCCAMLYKLRYA